MGILEQGESKEKWEVSCVSWEVEGLVSHLQGTKGFVPRWGGSGEAHPRKVRGYGDGMGMGTLGALLPNLASMNG